MTDRELLELAAKAAELPPIEWGNPKRDAWNPLEDDGDAMRLVVRLKQLGLWKAPMINKSIDGWHEDAYAATRRCITTIAAQIGKALP